ncbi:LysR family transcriptional regulator [Desulfomonile tiedjei]|uniref:Transcriptional regulator n=1 Tax=Desulfomonile tiedjei (strain ATCC 49306 / DSM 6799 / DCB-1) TaxID=706587 RepID=I4CEW3_DESTA|nr:LysR family transcriptional regulator [Desulfomonile tiedjei]AFM28104.1 transcriptional regulator [Desulfomonile tiedjei DSM 6799]
MEWQQIIGFYHVARLGSFTRAAEATFRTQPALSQQVSALEKELGCILIERIGRQKLRLTEAGMEFFKYAEEVLNKYDSFLEDLQDLQGVRKGTLTVAAPFTTLYHLFPRIFLEYAGKFPEVQITILDRPQKTVIDLIKAGEIDFGFVLESMLPAGFASWRWKKVSSVLMVPSGHPLLAEKPVTLDSVVQHPLILPPRGSLHSRFSEVEELLQKQGLSYRVIMESSNVELSSLYVEMGLGVSFATVVNRASILKGRKIEFIPLDHYFKDDYVVVSGRKNRRLSSPKSEFLNMILKKRIMET